MCIDDRVTDGHSDGDVNGGFRYRFGTRRGVGTGGVIQVGNGNSTWYNKEWGKWSDR